MNQQRAKEIENNGKTVNNPSSLNKRNHNRKSFCSYLILILRQLNLSDQDMMISENHTRKCTWTCSRDTFMKPFFYYNCLICRALIGSYISSIRVQTDKNLILASFQVQLSAIKLSTFSPMTMPVSSCLSLRRLIPHLFARHLMTVIVNKKLTSVC